MYKAIISSAVLYWCKMCWLILSKEDTFQVLKYKMVGKIFRFYDDGIK